MRRELIVEVGEIHAKRTCYPVCADGGRIGHATIVRADFPAR
jgi:hypothetical protein